MTDLERRPVTDSRELRCFPCCLWNCRRCYGDPCEHDHAAVPAPRVGAWPAQTPGDPFDLTVGDER